MTHIHGNSVKFNKYLILRAVTDERYVIVRFIYIQYLEFIYNV